VTATEGLAPKKSADTASVISELMMPHQVNNAGNIFGGELMAMVDRVAAVCAMRHAGRPCLTVAIDQVLFREPIYAGELVTCRARINFVGRTSMEIGVDVEAENLLSGNKRRTNTCLLTFVAVNEAGRPVPVPPLDLSDPADQRRYNEGKFRRKLRLALDREVVDEEE